MQGIRNEIGAVDAVGPFGDRPKELIGVHLLACAAIRGAGRSAPGEDHHWQRADISFRHIGGEVGRPWSGRDEADGGFAGQLRVGGSHAGGGLLVADEEMTNLRRVVETVIDRQHVSPGYAIDRANALGFQDVDDCAASGHLV